MKRSLTLLLAMLLALSCVHLAASAEVDPKYADHMTMHFASVQIKEGVDYNGDDLSKFFQEKYNFEWDILPMTWENWAEKMRIWINTGDMPDLATWNYVHGEAMNYAEQGLVRRLPDDWKTRWPNVAKAYENSQLGPAIEQLMGGTYFLPKPIFSANKPTDPLVSHMDLIMRKDWLEAVGAEIKEGYTTSEVLDIARMIKEQDPGQLGSKLLPINMTAMRAQGAFVTSNSAYSMLNNQFKKGEDGKYAWGPALPETLTGLKLYQQAYREGLLNPEFFTLKEIDDYASFYAAGQTGIYFSEGMSVFFQTAENELKKNLGLIGEEVMHYAYLLGEDGKYHNEETMNYWTCAIFNPNMDVAKFERLMDMFDFVASDEGQIMVRLGFEGKDYEVLADGEYNVLWPEGKGVVDIYPSVQPVYGNMIILSDDFAIINPAFPKRLRDVTLAMYHGKAKHVDETSVPRRDWDAYFQDSPSRRKVSFEFHNEYAQLITMDGDLEANWQNWIAEKAPLVDPVLEELNAIAAAK